MKKQSLYIPRPDMLGSPVNMKNVKRQPTHSFKAVSAIGASRQEGQYGGAVDKIGSVLTKKASAILTKLAKKAIK